MGQTKIWQTQRQDTATGSHAVSQMDTEHMATQQQIRKGHNRKRKARNPTKAT